MSRVIAVGDFVISIDADSGKYFVHQHGSVPPPQLVAKADSLDRAVRDAFRVKAESLGLVYSFDGEQYTHHARHD